MCRYGVFIGHAKDIAHNLTKKITKSVASYSSFIYSYDTNSYTIRVRLYHMNVRVWYVPYAYGMKYAYGTQHGVERDCIVGKVNNYGLYTLRETAY